MTWINNMFSNAPKTDNPALSSDAIFIDVRSPMEFATSHVAGAVQYLARQGFANVANGISAQSVARQFQKTIVQ